MSTTRDYYEALGVARNATFDEIRSSFRRLARQYHPDVNKSEDAAQKFSDVTEAYEVLSDPEKREKYDKFGQAGPRGQGWPGGVSGMGGHPSDVSAIFEELFGTRSPFGGGAAGGAGGGFGGGFGGGAEGDPFTGQSSPRRGRDSKHRLHITWMTAALGGTETIQVASPAGGRETISLKIPPGIDPDAKMRVPGKGELGPGASAGDLIVTVAVGSHPFFRREGRNVLIDLPLTIAEASLGTTITVPLLRGSVDLKVPPGTASGRSLRVKGQGIRGGKGPDGDFLAVIQIIPPKSLSDRGRAALEELAGELQNPRDSGPWVDTRSPSSPG